MKRSYSDNDRATALAALEANSGNVSGTSKQIGIPRATLTLWKYGGVNSDVTEICQEKKRSLADKLDEIAHKIADAMPEKIQRAGLQASAISLGTVIDKARLLRGESTVITESRDEWQRRIEQLAQKYGKSTDEVKRDIIERKPELATLLIQ